MSDWFDERAEHDDHDWFSVAVWVAAVGVSVAVWAVVIMCVLSRL